MRVDARVAAAFLILPLLGFSCVSVRPLTVSPTQAATYSLDLVASDFAKVASTVQGWAQADGYKEEGCRPTVGTNTPLCKKFAKGAMVIDVFFSSRENVTEVVLVDSSGGTKLSDVEKSLRPELERAFGKEAVKARYEK